MFYLPKKKSIAAAAIQVIDYISTTSYGSVSSAQLTQAQGDWFVVFMTDAVGEGGPTCSLNSVALTPLASVTDIHGYRHAAFAVQCTAATANFLFSLVNYGTTTVYRLRNIQSISAAAGFSTYDWQTSFINLPAPTGSNVLMALVRDRDSGATFDISAGRTLSQSSATYFKTTALEQKSSGTQYQPITVSGLGLSYAGVYVQLEIVSDATE